MARLLNSSDNCTFHELGKGGEVGTGGTVKHAPYSLNSYFDIRDTSHCDEYNVDFLYPQFSYWKSQLKRPGHMVSGDGPIMILNFAEILFAGLHRDVIYCCATRCSARGGLSESDLS